MTHDELNKLSEAVTIEMLGSINLDEVASFARAAMMRDMTGGFYDDHLLRATICATVKALYRAGRLKVVEEGKFKLGDRVTKTRGSSWTGQVVGTYSTALTPEGYAVESETETGSVQIYPAAALEAADLVPANAMSEAVGLFEWVAEQFSEAAHDDCENGVKCLNERAASEYLKEAPATLEAIRKVQDSIDTFLAKHGGGL